MTSHPGDDAPPTPPPPSDVPPPAPAPVPPGSNGPAQLAWGLGLIILVCVPFVSSLAAGIAMAVAGRSAQKHDGAVAENGRRAADWGLTYALLTVVLVGAHFGILAAAGTIEGFFPFGIIILTWAALTLAHLVISIIGLTRAGKGRVPTVWAIPFFGRS